MLSACAGLTRVPARDDASVNERRSMRPTPSGEVPDGEDHPDPRHQAEKHFVERQAVDVRVVALLTRLRGNGPVFIDE
jgi:hypothetical protein